MSTVIIAPTVRESQRIAARAGLHPREYTIVGTGQVHYLQGRRDVDVMIAECWYEHPVVTPFVNEQGKKDVRVTRPLSEHLAMLEALGEARVSRVPCA